MSPFWSLALTNHSRDQSAKGNGIPQPINRTGFVEKKNVLSVVTASARSGSAGRQLRSSSLERGGGRAAAPPPPPAVAAALGAGESSAGPVRATAPAPDAASPAGRPGAPLRASRTVWRSHDDDYLPLNFDDDDDQPVNYSLKYTEEARTDAQPSVAPPVRSVGFHLVQRLLFDIDRHIFTAPLFNAKACSF